jgi:hypothetical protein
MRTTRVASLMSTALVALAALAAAGCSLSINTDDTPDGWVPYGSWPADYDIPSQCGGSLYIEAPSFDGLCQGSSIYIICDGTSYSGYTCSDPTDDGFTPIPYDGPTDAGVDTGQGSDAGHSSGQRDATSGHSSQADAGTSTSTSSSSQPDGGYPHPDGGFHHHFDAGM